MTISLPQFISLLGTTPPGDMTCPPFNCGTGLLNETPESGSENDCFMLVTEHVTPDDFMSFLATMEQNGAREGFSRTLFGNLFAEFLCSGRIVYTYYTARKSEARFILDPVSVPLGRFAIPDSIPVREDSALMQFSLKYGSMIPGHSCDCGMLYAIRLRDNSLIIVDGGEKEQATDEAMAELITRLYDLADTPESEPLRISLWVATHNHDDHMDVFIKLMRLLEGRMVLERVMFNFPSATLMHDQNPSELLLKERIRRYFPDVLFLKPHTGMTFPVPFGTVEILTTHEDILPCSFHAEEGRTYRGMNESTTIFKITFDGTSVLFLGDAEMGNEEALATLYPEGTLRTDYLQCAHHMINAVPRIYAMVQAKKLLIPQGRYMSSLRNGDIAARLTGLFGAENMYYAGDCTYVFSVKDGEESISLYEQKGYFYDGSEL